MDGKMFVIPGKGRGRDVLILEPEETATHIAAIKHHCTDGCAIVDWGTTPFNSYESHFELTEEESREVIEFAVSLIGRRQVKERLKQAQQVYDQAKLDLENAQKELEDLK